MITNKKNIFKTYLEPLKGGLGPGDDPDDYPLTRIFISVTSGANPGICSIVGDVSEGFNSIYINYATTPFVPSLEDYLFLDYSLNNPFQGADQYYVVYIDGSLTTYYVRVNNLGMITDVGVCV